MITNRPYPQRQVDGFALVLSLIVVGVVLSVALTILDLSIKQVRLSSNAKDSEIAFQAANAGMECARFWRRDQAAAMEIGDPITPSCFGTTPSPNTRNQITSDISGDGEAFLYQHSFDWGGTDPRCTQISTLVASTSVFGVGLTIGSMSTHIPGFPDPTGTDEKFCDRGTRCSVISVRGYNRPCSSTTGFGVIQREVLLQF